VITENEYPLLLLFVLLIFIGSVVWIIDHTHKAEAAVDQWYVQHPPGSSGYQPWPIETEVPLRANEGCAHGMPRPSQTMVRYNGEGEPVISLGEGLPAFGMATGVYQIPETGQFATDWLFPNGNRVTVRPVVRVA
jgi:hypothetical protein